MTVPELVAGLPTMIGCDPVEIVVALAVDEDFLPLMAQVIDRKRLLDPEHTTHMAAAVAREFAEERACAALLVSFTDDDIREACPALDALRLELEFVVDTIKLVGVQNGRLFWPGCHGECCPPQGKALPPVPALLPHTIRPRGGSRWPGAARGASAEEEAFAARVNARGAAARRWALALADGAVGDAATARALAADLDDLCVRDFVVLTVLGADIEAVMDVLVGVETGAVAAALDGALTGSEPPDPLLADRFQAVVRRVARGARGKRRKAATLTLLAILDWWEGELGAAVEHCDAALAAAADYRLAELVRTAASRGIAPGWLAAEAQVAQTRQ